MVQSCRNSRRPLFICAPTSNRSYLIRSAGGDFDERGVFFGAFDEVESAQEMIALGGVGVLIGDDLGQQRRGLGRARAPDDFAASGRVPVLTDLGEPGVEEF